MFFSFGREYTHSQSAVLIVALDVQDKELLGLKAEVRAEGFLDGPIACKPKLKPKDVIS